MWLRWFGVFSVLSILAVTAQDIEEDEGIRCYDCNSFNPHCRDQVNQSSPTDGYAVFSHCPKTNRCFIRKDQDGVIVRGCADGWRFSLVDIEYLGCKEQSADWLGNQVWCFCDEDLCNRVPMAQLNRGEYMQMSESSEYLSVNTDLEVEHELTGWKSIELLEKQIATEKTDSTPSTETSKQSTTNKPTTTKTPTATVPMTTVSQSTFTSKKVNNSSIKTTRTRETTTVRVTIPKQTSNFTTENFSQPKSNVTSGKPSTFKFTTKATTTPKSSSTTEGTSKTSPKTITTRSFSETSTTTKSKSFGQSTTKETTTAIRNTTASATSLKASTMRVTPKPSTIATATNQTEKKVDVPWWLWHVVSPTTKPTPSTTTSSPYTQIIRGRGGRRRSYVKPKLNLVTKHPRGDGIDRADMEMSGTTPSSGSERWTWSPSWWDKWWRPGTRRPRRPKRPNRKYPRRPLPTQGRGHYWWLAPVGPTRRTPPTKKYSSSTKTFSPTTKKLSLITKKPTFARRQSSTTTTTTTTKKQTTMARKTPPTYVMATSTPLPSRLYPKFPNWGRRLTNPKKSIYPVITTKKPRPTTRVMNRRRTMKLSSYATRHATATAKKTSTDVPPTTVKVTTRRRRPTTLARRRKYPKNRPKPEIQQKISEEFFCWDCYSASTNCQDVVNSPYSYYVGRTPCPYTKKCFVRKDAGVIYRGCADGWTSSLIERDYNGCKVQYTWGRPVEWCFCDSPLCNGESIKHIKAIYNSHITDGNNNVNLVNLPIGEVMEKTVYRSPMSNQLRQ